MIFYSAMSTCPTALPPRKTQRAVSPVPADCSHGVLVAPAGSVIACEKVSHQRGFGQQQLRAFSLAALGQFNRDTSALPHFSDGKIGGEPIVDQIEEKSSIPNNMKNGSGHTCELYHQFFILVVLGKVEFGHNWGKPTE